MRRGGSGGAREIHKEPDVEALQVELPTSELPTHFLAYMLLFGLYAAELKKHIQRSAPE